MFHQYFLIISYSSFLQVLLLANLVAIPAEQNHRNSMKIGYTSFLTNGVTKTSANL